MASERAANGNRTARTARTIAPVPTTRIIAPGISMPYVNLGGVHSHPSNYTLWLEKGGRGLGHIVDIIPYSSCSYQYSLVFYSESVKTVTRQQ